MIEIQSLTFTHQNHFLFQNLSFEVGFGELLQVTGANGAGKTTLLRILANLLKPSSGDIRFIDHSIYQNKSRYQTHMAYLGHTNAIKPGLTVRENLISHAILMDARQSKIDAQLKQFGLTSLAKTFAYQLSQGQQRRLALAKVSLSEKSVWILDEPLEALDQEGISQFNHSLKEHLRSQGIAIIATHHPLDPDLNAIPTLKL